jgi:hypothetical protein
MEPNLEELAAPGIAAWGSVRLVRRSSPWVLGAWLWVADASLCAGMWSTAAAISSWILWKACRPSSLDGCGIVAASLMASTEFCSVLENTGAARRMSLWV